MAVRFRYCPPSAVDSSLLQHYASVDDRNRIICSQCRRALVPVPRAAASSGKRHPTLQGVHPEKQSIEHIPSADTRVIMSSKKITVVDLFDQAALRDPSGIAATFDGKCVSYGQLRNASIRIVVRLRAQGVKPRNKVPLLTTMGLDMLVGVLGVLRTGACYCPIDVIAWSLARILTALRAVGSALLASTVARVDVIEQAGGYQLCAVSVHRPGANAYGGPHLYHLRQRDYG